MMPSSSLLADPDQVHLFEARFPAETRIVQFQRRKKYGAVKDETLCILPVRPALSLVSIIDAFHVEAPEQCVVFVSLDPLSPARATGRMAKACADAVCDGRALDVVGQAVSCLMKSVDRSNWIHLDVDTTDPSGLDAFLAEHGIPVSSRIQTRGGFHTLIDRTHGHPGFAHLTRDALASFSTTRCSGDQHESATLLPLPGTFQGGAVVRFL